MGRKIEIRDIVILIAFTQWIIGPILCYSFFPSHHTYYMAVSQEMYMAYVMPATVAFALGLYCPSIGGRVDEVVVLKSIEDFLLRYPNFDFILILLGLIASFLKPYVPSAIKFFFYLVSALQFVGLYFLLLNPRRKMKWTIFCFIMGGLLLRAINSAMFHDLLLWLTFLILILSFIYQVSFAKKILGIVALLILVFTIQTVKYKYRQMVWYEAGGGAKQFAGLVKDNFSDTENFFSENNLENFVYRINQGWIIARIIAHVPEKEPYAQGETIVAGIKATLLPRFLFPSKMMGGGVKNFERFTGHELQPGTSMNLSIVGEMYANFGKNWGILAMFFLGLFYNLIYKVLLRLTKKTPVILLFLPLIFLQTVKAESDFVTNINHLIKSLVAITIVFFVLRNFLKIKV